MEYGDNLRGNVSSDRHTPSYDTNSINRVIERASKEDNFISNAVSCIKEMRFPAYKKDIVDHATRNVNADSDMLALFESLDGYIEYRDLYHVQKALEENNSEKKKTYQISDQTREQPDVRKLDTTADNSIKDREAVDETEESKLHPEVSPTAMSNFICNICGKPFQNQNDLVQHQRFEGTTPS
jgi:Protein of unknown function (DUF2795)